MLIIAFLSAAFLMLKLFPPLLACEVCLSRDFPLVSCVPSIRGTESARLISVHCSSPLSYSQPSLSPCTFSGSSRICHDAWFADLLPFFWAFFFFFPHSIFLLLSHRPLYSLAQAAVTKYRRLGVLTEIYFLDVLEAESPKSRRRRGRFLPRHHSLGC